jgi:hypothetical protein
VPCTYASGEIIRKGDRIRYAGGDGVIDLVADPEVADPETEYYVDQFGGGCMLLTEQFGRIFLDEPDADEDLAFVSRAEG